MSNDNLCSRSYNIGAFNKVFNQIIQSIFAPCMLVYFKDGDVLQSSELSSLVESSLM